MYLEQILISNFRLFNNLDLKLDPGLNIIVGENDSGKTALIDAIRYVLGTNSQDRAFLDESDFHQDEKELSIQLKFLNIDRHAHVFVEHLTYEKNTEDENKRHAVLYVQLTAKITGQERRGYPFISTEIKTGKDGNGLNLDAEIRAFLYTTYLKPLRDAEAGLSAGKSSRLSQILNSSKALINSESREEILKLIAETNASLIEEGKPIQITSKKIENEYLHQLVFEQDKDWVKAIIDIAGIKDVEGLSENQKRKYLRSVLEGLTLSLSEEQRKHGLGYSNLLFMAAELLLLEQELESEYPLLLIEEPEAQLQIKLLEFITSKSRSEREKPGIQCILTTHSPNISSKADPQNVIILNKGKSFSLRPNETELNKENYRFLKKFLDVTKANLFFARGIILVEGDAENILLPSIAKLLGRPLENYGVSIINIGNTGWKHFAKLFLRKGKDTEESAWNPVKVAVLRDLDLWPDCAEEKLSNSYGFKVRKEGNTNYWENGKDIDAHKEAYKKEGGKTLERQNISINISDRWTLEYCFSFYGLFNECYEALNGSLEGKENITGSEEEKATYVQREVQSLKPDFATKLALLIEKNYVDRPLELKNKLPPYMVSAIEHVTKSLEDNTTAAETNDAVA